MYNKKKTPFLGKITKEYQHPFGKPFAKLKQAKKSRRNPISKKCLSKHVEHKELETTVKSFVKDNQTKKLKEDNSVPNRIQPRKQSGLYMIRCIMNDWRYYGESRNVVGRISSHRSMLNRHIHYNVALQRDWNTYKESNFEFIVLFMGANWDLPHIRRGKELELIILDRGLCYNILDDISRQGEKNPFWGKIHTPETKKKISEALQKPNDKLGKKISIKNVIYPSIAEASRQTGMARKTIRNKINDSKLETYFTLKESGTVERPS